MPLFAAPANWVDPVKIAAKIREQQVNWLEKAALSPLTGRVLVIGMKRFGEAPVYLEGDERDILLNFWAAIDVDRQFDEFYGHNLYDFDLPYIIRRSWVHGIPVRIDVVMSGRYINERRFHDTMVAWKCGSRSADYVSLDTVAKFFGFAGKSDDIGANFAEIYATDPERALAYLGNDLTLTEGVAKIMFGHHLRAAA